jgi:hypothetical protein
MLQRWRSHKASWRSSKTGTGSNHFTVLGKAARWTWKQLARHYQTSTLDMEAVGTALPDICAIVDAYAKKDVFNMDETGLYWRLQADNLLATQQVEFDTLLVDLSERPKDLKAERSTRSVSLLSFAQTCTSTKRFR